MSASGSVADYDRSDYEPLLHKVEVLYARYEARRRKPFNLFSVLRKPSDEEHLHSKFLEALLEWKSPEDGAMRNLEDFVQETVAPAVDTAREEAELREAEREGAESRGDSAEPHPPRDTASPPTSPDESQERHQMDAGDGDTYRRGSLGTEKFSFSLDGAKIERERHHIDLLITNAKGQAIVIENKIWAGDQDRQLQRYFERVTGDGLRPTLLYLTLDGHGPSDGSLGCLKADEVVCLSYKSTLMPWLRRCQERACAEPALRESVAQYIALIRTLCGDSGREYMTELTKFLREGNNLVLARRLGDAATKVWIDLLFDYWERVRREVELKMGVPVEKDLRERIDRFVWNYGHHKGQFHYSWNRVDGVPAKLAIEASRHHGGIFYGVLCERKAHREEYDRLKDKLSSAEYGHDGGATPWWSSRKFVYKGSVDSPSEKAIAVLNDSQKRSEVVQDLIQTWEALRKPGSST